MANPFEGNGEQVQITLKDQPAPFDITVKHVDHPVVVKDEATGEPTQQMGKFVQVWVSGPFGIYTFYMPPEMAEQVGAHILDEARIAKSGIEVASNIEGLRSVGENGHRR